MKVAVRGLAPEAALPLLWARGIEGAPSSSSTARDANALDSDVATSDVEGAPVSSFAAYDADALDSDVATSDVEGAPVSPSATRDAGKVDSDLATSDVVGAPISPSASRDAGAVDSDLAASRPAHASRSADVLLCDDADVPRADDPPRVVWTFGLLAPTAAAALVRTLPFVLPAPEPEPAADASTAELLASMRRDYTRQLPSSLAALARAVVHAPSGATAQADARMLAHRLRGTAGSYGHPAIGELAGRLEQRLAAGDLAPAPLGELLLALAERIAAALSPAALPAQPRVAVVGLAPPGLPEGSIAVPDVSAAARAIEAGAAELLWVSLDGDGPVSNNISRETFSQLCAAIDAEPVLQDIPVVLARTDAGNAAKLALACLLASAWARLALAFPAVGHTK